MNHTKRKQRGQSVVEFLALILFLLGVFFIFQKYLVRGIHGRWKEVGDAMGQGRIYSPNHTRECVANRFFDGQTLKYYDYNRFVANGCRTKCLGSTANIGLCNGCLNSSRRPECEPLP